MLKKCSCCGRYLPLNMFVGKDGYCKICRRDYNWQYFYGVSPEEYYEMYKEQGGKCKICGCELEDEYLNIDHDSKTGEVRGLLCPNCNKGLGLFNEDINALKGAIKYLEGSRCQEQ